MNSIAFGLSIIVAALLILFSFFIDDSHSKKLNKTEQELPDYTTIIVIDKCEYIYVDRYQASAITHKGNCKNHLTTPAQ